MYSIAHISALIVSLLLCGGVIIAVCLRLRSVRNRSEHLPCEEVGTVADEGLTSPQSTTSKGAIYELARRTPGNAVFRAEPAISTVKNDDLPPVVVSVMGACENRYVQSYCAFIDFVSQAFHVENLGL